MPFMHSCSAQACDRLRSEPRNGCRRSAAASVRGQPQDTGYLDHTQSIDRIVVGSASSSHWQRRTTSSEIVPLAATRLTLGTAKPGKKTCGTFPASVHMGNTVGMQHLIPCVSFVFEGPRTALTSWGPDPKGFYFATACKRERVYHRITDESRKGLVITVVQVLGHMMEPTLAILPIRTTVDHSCHYPVFRRIDLNASQYHCRTVGD